MLAAAADQQAQAGYHDQGRDRFTEIKTNPVKVTAQEPVSTFSIDVDTPPTPSCAPRSRTGVLPQQDAVRVEEMVNYFDYDYAGPARTRDEPFKPTVDGDADAVEPGHASSSTSASRATTSARRAAAAPTWCS